jgi:hypothetical protein
MRIPVKFPLDCSMFYLANQGEVSKERVIVNKNKLDILDLYI